MFNITNHQGNTNHNHNEISPHTCQINNIRKTTVTSIDGYVEKRVPSCTLLEMSIGEMKPLWRKSLMSPKKLKIELSYDTENPFLGIFSEENKNVNSKRCMYFYVHCNIIYSCQDMNAT